MTTHPQQPENMSNEDIIAVALRIREEDTRQVKVRPWKSRHRTAWYIAIPAACLVSFFLGYFVSSATTKRASQGFTAQVSSTTDTVVVREVVHDTIYQTHHLSNHKPSSSSAAASHHGIDSICFVRVKEDRCIRT